MTDSTTAWLIIFAIGLGTFALRLSFIELLGRASPPPYLQRALRFVPAAVMAALVLPALVNLDGAPDLSLGNERLLAGALAAFVAWRTRQVLLTLAVGMAALWLLQAYT
ncbi:AzlD domain-containing protein [Pseudomonas lalucatii]|uniref:AzlD domain-containing protein n=1 Tax=Pseudomonas lalucatii TaxID=1424203 RepID=A0ABS5Q0Y4_9PSED|nr:AzlD domain-containing protein [Pseudomonas lalucatii]MBS7690438.1 AzlD domain-containing protein [Pseudomonas lalucatii]MBS7726075.1 AzlD domain-containing protein [Pseudomonas lalucatii]QVM88352.1 AzlD domain-containing protein [Pseudomonas lalucatii]